MNDNTSKTGIAARPSSRWELGRSGERAAEEFLLARGLRLVERNWRDGRNGEIDLIFEEDGTVVFVEVKTRRGLSDGEILQAVDARKLARLRRLAGRWLSRRADYCDYRIDAVAVGLGPDGEPPRIAWLRGIDR